MISMHNLLTAASSSYFNDRHN